MMKTLTVPTLLRLVAAAGAAGSIAIGAAAVTPALAATAPGPSPAASPASPANPSLGDRRQDRRQVLRAVFDAEAEVLGLKPEQLRADLRGGQTVGGLAAAKGITKDQFAARLATDAQPGLDKLVDNHQITAAQEQKVLQATRGGKVPFWNRGLNRDVK